MEGITLEHFSKNRIYNVYKSIFIHILFMTMKKMLVTPMIVWFVYSRNSLNWDF